jgi:transposase-like protein
MAIDREGIKKLIKESGVKSLEDFNALMKEISKEILETLLDEEMTDHLGYEKHDQQSKQTDNSRNGYNSKEVKSSFGTMPLEVPRDRKSEFNPTIVKKRQKDISGLDEKIISMYAKGMTVRDIQTHIEDIYGYKMSPETISNMTESVLEKAREWQNRPLREIYAITFLDALFLKIRKEGRIINIAVYAIIGIDLDGNKECFGLWMAETESSKYWLTVLNELKNRGVQDILIFSVDGLSGLSDAIRAVFPKAEIQRCIVHQIRNSLKYVSWKDRKPIAQDLKKIYSAVSEEEALKELEEFEQKWGKKFPNISTSWRKNWGELATFFKYPKEIRTLIYTTNPIESFNRGLKKVSKNRAVFPSEDAIFKLLFLAINDIQKRWTQTIRNWGVIYAQLSIFFEERISNHV